MSAIRMCCIPVDVMVRYEHGICPAVCRRVRGLLRDTQVGSATWRVTQTALGECVSDHTVRLWNLEDASSSSLTLQGHSDYVMALAQGTRGNHTKFVSGGLQCEIFCGTSAMSTRSTPRLLT